MDGIGLISMAIKYLRISMGEQFKKGLTSYLSTENKNFFLSDVLANQGVPCGKRISKQKEELPASYITTNTR